MAASPPDRLPEAILNKTATHFGLPSPAKCPFSPTKRFVAMAPSFRGKGIGSQADASSLRAKIEFHCYLAVTKKPTPRLKRVSCES